MTEADRFLSEMKKSQETYSVQECQPLTKYGTTEDVPMNEQASSGPNVGLRVVAVIVFLALFLPATYLAKVSPRPSIILGYTLGVIAFTVAGLIWRAGGK